MNKKGFVGLWADVFKGIIYGFIIAVVLMLLIINGIVPLPFGIDLCGCA
jgi:tetrahydromethanopterin S-methyltransferase subunit F